MKLTRVATLALAVTLLVLFTLVMVLQPGSGALSDSAGSAAPRGRLAAFLVLEELGFEPELWRGPPGELPGGRHVLWMPRPPREFAAYEASGDYGDDPLEQARRNSDFGAHHYRSFVEGGGVVLIEKREQALDFLVEGLGLEEEPLQDGRLEDAPVLADGQLDTRPGPDRTEHYDSNGALVAIEIELGKGAFVLLPGGSWARNRRFEEGDRALLVVRLVERFQQGGRVLFDESVLAGPAHEGPLDLAFSARARLLSFHVLLLALLLTWSRAWSREFPRDPRPHDQLSPLARARALAGLLVRARRLDLLADFLRAGTLRRLGDETPPGWTDALAGRPVVDMEGLVRLDRDLRAFEGANRRTT